MKKNIIMVMAVVAAAAVTGCNRNSNTENTGTVDTNMPPATNDMTLGSTNPSVSQQATDMATNAWAKTKEATTNAWADMKESLSSAWDYSYDKKDAFIEDATNDMATLDQKIQTLSDKAATASDSVKADAQTKIQELRAKRAVLDQKLEDVKNSTAANWNDVKAGFQASYEDAKTSVKQAWQWLKDKMSQ
jgi:predicted  nucleic acid-binding Zn-ribbon protein